MADHFSPAAVGRWSIRHPWLAITVWLAFVLVSVGLLIATGSRQLTDGSVGQSARGDALENAHLVGPGQTTEIYLRSGSVPVTGASFKVAIAQVSAVMRHGFGGPVTTQIGADQHSALLTGLVTRGVSPTAITWAVAGFNADHQRISAQWVNDSVTSNDLQRAERLSVPVTLLVLLIAFGALVAAIVPVLLAVTAVVAAFGLLGPISHLFPLDNSVQTVVLLIGMAVGVDYALFYVIRSREERNRGLAARPALERTARTSGRTVVIAGSTVAAAMAGQFAIGSDIFNGIASGTIAVIACAVMGSVTVLPAVLALLGRRMDAGIIPFLPHLGSGDDSKLLAEAGRAGTAQAGRLARVHGGRADRARAAGDSACTWRSPTASRCRGAARRSCRRRLTPSFRARPPPRWSCSLAQGPPWPLRALRCAGSNRRRRCAGSPIRRSRSTSAPTGGPRR